MSKEATIKKNMIYNTIGSFFYLGCQWLTTILIVHLGNYTLAGELTLAISLTNIFISIANFGIRNYQVSDIEDKYAAGEYVMLRYVTCIISTLLCICFILINKHYSLEQMLVILLYMGFRVSESISDVMQGIQQKKNRMDYIAVSYIGRGVLGIVGFTIGLVITKSLIIAIVLMAISCYAVIYVYDYRKCKQIDTLHITYSKKVTKVLVECLPLMITLLLTTSCVSIPRYFLESILGKEMLGYYGTVATPAVIIQSLCIVIYTPLITLIAENYDQKNRNGYCSVIYKTVGLMLALSLVAILGARLFGRFGLTLLFGENISNYVYLFVPVIITTIMMAFVYFFNMVLTIARRLWGIMIANATAVIVITIISSKMIEQFGLNGVNITLIIGLGLDIILLVSIWLYDIKKKLRDNGGKDGRVRE